MFSDLYSQTVSEATGASANTGGSNAQQGRPRNEYFRASEHPSKKAVRRLPETTLDFKITGEGLLYYSGVPMGNTYYTRNGAFDLDDQGNLVTQDR